MFATDKVGNTMKANLNPAQAKAWFGAQPPDLTLVARSRAAIGSHSGPDYLYTLLRTYYRDETKPTGWNNLAFPNIGMPHPCGKCRASASRCSKKCPAMVTKPRCCAVGNRSSLAP
jgi:cytochrome c1